MSQCGDKITESERLPPTIYPLKSRGFFRQSTGFLVEGRSGCQRL